MTTPTNTPPAARAPDRGLIDDGSEWRRGPWRLHGSPTVVGPAGPAGRDDSPPTRPTLAVAAAFTFAAGVAAVVPHHTGPWLPLHLFLVGGLLTAISAATQFLAVTWSAAPPPPQALVGTQRVLLAFGVLGLGLGRELNASPVFLGAAGSTVIASFVLLQVWLVGIRTAGKLDRFRPAIDGYLIAVSFGLLGCGAGIALASGVAADRDDLLRSAHLIVNVFAWSASSSRRPCRTWWPPRSDRRWPRGPHHSALRSTTGLLTAATVLACTGVLWAVPRVPRVARLRTVPRSASSRPCRSAPNPAPSPALGRPSARTRSRWGCSGGPTRPPAWP